MLVFHWGKAESLVSVVELGVVGAEEDIAEDPERSVWWWDVEAHEARDALLLTSLFDLQDVLTALEWELLASDDEGYFRE